MNRTLAMALAAIVTGFAAMAQNLIPNGDFEEGADAPASWGAPNPAKGIDYPVEEGNRFARVHSDGGTAMIYREFNIPEGTEALRLAWRWRVTGLKKGAQPWFDARIMMEYMDRGRGKVGGAPGAPNRGKDTDGWEAREITFLVPAEARILKFMPSLLNVAAGTVDFDDFVLEPIDPAPLRAAAEKAAAERAAKIASQVVHRREKAGKAFADRGSLLPGEASFRLEQTQPGKLLNHYRVADIPDGVEALRLSWREKVTDLVCGEKPWFDARVISEFLGPDNKKLQGVAHPPAVYTQRDQKDWRDREITFLVPSNAVALAVMPCLFQVKAGIYEIEDLKLVPADPAVPRAEAEKRRAQEAARYVPPEDPKTNQWPRPLHVEGPKVLDDKGREVWLQGVSLSGTESVANDRQAEKSTVVAIDEWKANCIRLPVKEDFWFGRTAYQSDGGKGYRELIGRVITLAANRGAYVVLDLHRFRAPKAEHVEFWKDAATRYKNHPAVLFELFNEPHGIDWKTLVEGGWVGDAEKHDESAFLTEEEKRKNRGFESVGLKGLLAAVRSTGARNPVIVSGVFWTNDLTGWDKGWAMEDPDGDGILYSWHTYNWHPGWARVLPVAAKHPVFVGECGGDEKKMGFIKAEDQEDPNTFCPDLLGFIQEHKLHWTGWCMHTASTPRLLLDWDYTPTPFWGAYVRRALSGERFAMKRMR